jgi:hypothetical protein
MPSSLQSKILLAGAGALLILSIALCNYTFVRNIDTGYTRIISSDTRIYASLQAISAETSIMQRALLNMVLTDDSLEIAHLKAEVFRASKKIDHQYAKLGEMKGIAHRELLGKLGLSCLSYRQACGTFILLVQARSIAEAIRYNKKELHPLFLDYQKSQEQFLSAVSAHSAQSSSALSSQTNALGVLTIAIAGVPLAVWVAGLVLLIIWIFVASRRSKSGLATTN